MHTLQSRPWWLIGGIGIIVSLSLLSCVPSPAAQDVTAIPVAIRMTDTKQADALATIAAALTQPATPSALLSPTTTPLPTLDATETTQANWLATAVAATLTAQVTNTPMPTASNSPEPTSTSVPATATEVLPTPISPTAPSNEFCEFAFRILDKNSNQPIANASVFVTLGTRQEAGKTDETGYYGSKLSCSNPQNSKIRVRVTVDRYQPYAATTSVIDEVQEIMLAQLAPASPTPMPAAKIPTPAKTAPVVKTPPSPAGALEILEPRFGESISAGPHKIRWRYTGQLAKGQGFDLLLWYEGDKNKKLGVTDAQKIAANLVNLGNGEYSVTVSLSGAKLVEQFCNASYWLTVMVVQLDPYQRIGPESKGINIQVEPLPSATCQ